MFLHIMIFLINSSPNGTTPPEVLWHFISTWAVHSGSVMHVDSHSSLAQCYAFLNKFPTFLMYQITETNFGRLFAFLRLLSDSTNLSLALQSSRSRCLSLSLFFFFFFKYIERDKLDWKWATHVPKQGLQRNTQCDIQDVSRGWAGRIWD